MSERDTVDFSAPGTDDYKQRITKAKEGGAPVGGAPMPKMPRFDQDPGGGNRHAGMQPNIPVDKILRQDEQDELKRQGKLMPGVGSAYVANQPKLEEPAQPQVVNPPRQDRGLRPETVAGLEEMAAYTRTDPRPAPTEESITKEVDKEVDDFSEFGQRVRSLINNKKRREAIEKRITDSISIEDLVTLQEVRQTVPIVPGKFYPNFRTTNGHEDLWVKRAMGTETGSDSYIMDKYAMMNLTCGLYALNGTPLPPHQDKEGYIDEALFEKKQKVILKYPWNLLADLSVNYVWFLRRVEKALVVDDIKDF